MKAAIVLFCAAFAFSVSASAKGRKHHARRADAIKLSDARIAPDWPRLTCEKEGRRAMVKFAGSTHVMVAASDLQNGQYDLCVIGEGLGWSTESAKREGRCLRYDGKDPKREYAFEFPVPAKIRDRGTFNFTFAFYGRGREYRWSGLQFLLIAGKCALDDEYPQSFSMKRT